MTILKLLAAKPLLLLGAMIVFAGCQTTYNPNDSTVEPQQVADYLSGGWTASVEKHPEEDNIRGLNGPLSFVVQPFDGNTAPLRGLASRLRFDGSVEVFPAAQADAAGAASDAGTDEPWTGDESFPMKDAPTHARLRFTTGDFEVSTQSGVRRVKGPLEWTGVLRHGRLYGQVSDPGGRTTRWYATKN